MTGNRDHEDRFVARSRRVDAVAGERQAILRRERARRRKEEAARQLARTRAALGAPCRPSPRVELGRLAV